MKMPLNNLQRYYKERYRLGCELYDTVDRHAECLEIFDDLLDDARLPYLLRAKTCINMSNGLDDWHERKRYHAEGEIAYAKARDMYPISTDSQHPSQGRELRRIREALNKANADLEDCKPQDDEPGLPEINDASNADFDLPIRRGPTTIPLAGSLLLQEPAKTSQLPPLTSHSGLHSNNATQDYGDTLLSEDDEEDGGVTIIGLDIET